MWFVAHSPGCHTGPHFNVLYVCPLSPRGHTDPVSIPGSWIQPVKLHVRVDRLPDARHYNPRGFLSGPCGRLATHQGESTVSLLWHLSNTPALCVTGLQMRNGICLGFSLPRTVPSNPAGLITRCCRVWMARRRLDQQHTSQGCSHGQVGRLTSIGLRLSSMDDARPQPSLLRCSWIDT